MMVRFFQVLLLVLALLIPVTTTLALEIFIPQNGAKYKKDAKISVNGVADDGGEPAVTISVRDEDVVIMQSGNVVPSMMPNGYWNTSLSPPSTWTVGVGDVLAERPGETNAIVVVEFVN